MYQGKVLKTDQNLQSLLTWLLQYPNLPILVRFTGEGLSHYVAQHELIYSRTHNKIIVMVPITLEGGEDAEYLFLVDTGADRSFILEKDLPSLKAEDLFTGDEVHIKQPGRPDPMVCDELMVTFRICGTKIHARCGYLRGSFDQDAHSLLGLDVLRCTNFSIHGTANDSYCGATLGPGDPSCWTPVQVCRWLQNVQLRDYAENFLEHQIDGSKLMAFTDYADDELKTKLIVQQDAERTSPFGDRRNLIEYIKGLQECAAALCPQPQPSNNDHSYPLSSKNTPFFATLTLPCLSHVIYFKGSIAGSSSSVITQEPMAISCTISRPTGNVHFKCYIACANYPYW